MRRSRSSPPPDCFLSDLLLESVFDASSDSILVFRLDENDARTLVAANDSACGRLGYERDELLAQTPDRVLRNPQALLGDPAAKAPEEAGADRFKAQLIRRDGAVLGVEVSLRSFSFDGSRYSVALGHPSGDRHQAEQNPHGATGDASGPLRDTHHRFKNHLQSVAALLNIQQASAQDDAVQEALGVAQNRLFALGLLQRTLYESGQFLTIDLSRYLRLLADSLKSSQGSHSSLIQLALDTPPVDIDPDSALPIGLIATEAIANSLSHGFPDGKAGRIQLSVQVEQGTLTGMSIRDDGVGFDPDAVSGGLGLQVIRMLTAQLKGSVRISADDGTCVEIAFAKASRD